jgi:hypothetical protein
MKRRGSENWIGYFRNYLLYMQNDYQNSTKENQEISRQEAIVK